jgi:excisionase family DNA binding protein
VAKREIQKQDVTPPTRLLYPQADCAVLLGVSERTVRYWIASGILATRRMGKRILVPADELKRFASTDQPSPPSVIKVKERPQPVRKTSSGKRTVRKESK